MDTTSRCGLCGKDIPAGGHFCPGCGTPTSRVQEQREHHARLATGLLSMQYLLHTRYIIGEKIAQGGQSAVYRATDTVQGDVVVAIKEMSEADLTADERKVAVDGFRREAQMLYNLEHPALVKVHEIFIEEQKHYIVMEFVQGRNLEDELMDYGRPLPYERVMPWGIALCDVLSYLHALTPPIIYRDLKPPNVMLTPQGAIKLVDFGIARWLHPSRQRDTTQLGTDGYAPPEQYAGRSEPRSDQYALGASLYHLLTGRVPEAAPLRMAGRTLAPIRSINPQVPELVERVIQQSLSLVASDRFPTTQHMRHALQWAVNPTPRATAAPALEPQRVAATVNSTTSRPSARPARTATSRTAGPATPPRLHIWPLRLDAGFLEVNQVRVLLLEVANRGGGALTGLTETNLPCLRIEPAKFDAATQSLRVHIDTANLPLGPYVCHLAVRTNGGDQIVPVRFVVRPAGDAGQARQRTTSH